MRWAAGAGRAVSVTLCLWAAGCPAPQQPLAAIVLDTASVQPRVDYADLAAVLKKALDARGNLVGEDADEWVGRLDSQLKTLAVTGPTASPQLLPTAADRLAYWYNARAAWAIQLAVLAGLHEEMSPAELEDRPFPLDGRTLTLKDIDAVLAEDGDWQVLVAAPGIHLQRARLPAEPLAAEGVRGAIRQRLSDFVDDADRFIVDVDRKRIVVPPVLWRYRDQLTRQHRSAYGVEEATFTTVLLPYVTGSAHRRLQDAVGYACAAARPQRKVSVIKED